MPRQQPDGKRVLQSALRCLEVLDALAAVEKPVAVSELARHLGVRRGTLHQQLQTLAQAGWVKQTSSARYYLSLRAVRIGRVALEQAGITSRLLPLLHELAMKTGEAAAVAVLDMHDVLVVQRVESEHLVRADIKVGSRMPLSTSASGRVLLAYASEEQLEAIRAGGIQLPDRDYLENVRRSGYALQVDEYMSGLSSGAVPIHTGEAGEVLALSMAAPSGRFDSARMVTDLLAAAERFHNS